jgi:WD40 repeat protein
MLFRYFRQHRRAGLAGVLMLLWPAFLPSQDRKAVGLIPEFRTLAFSADGKLLAAGSGEPEEPGVLTVWNVATRKPLLTHPEKRGIPSVAFSPDGKLLAVGAFEDECRLIDVAKVHHRSGATAKASRLAKNTSAVNSGLALV